MEVQSRDHHIYIIEGEACAIPCKKEMAIFKSKDGCYYPAQVGKDGELDKDRSNLEKNSNRDFSEDTNFITIKLKMGYQISSGGSAIIGLSIARKSGMGDGLTQNISSVILNGSGGDSYPANNQSILNISTI